MNRLFTLVFLAFLLMHAPCVCGQGRLPDSRDQGQGHSSDFQGLGPQRDGSILVPTNQLLRPAGTQVILPGRPVALALTPDGKFLLVKNNGDLDLVRAGDGKVLQALPYKSGGASFTGICLSGDGSRVYTANASDRVYIAQLDSDHILHWEAPVLLPGPSIGGSPVPGGLALDSHGDKLYVTLSRNNSLAVVDLRDRVHILQVPVGIAPYAVLLGSSGKAYVSNWGGRRPRKGETVYNTSGSDVLVDPRTGVADHGSVSVIDLDRNVETKSIEVGLHPSGMALSPNKRWLYVACANSDKIWVIDTKTDRAVDSISVHQENDLPFGSAPNALAVSPDGAYLYAANGTENAVCIIRTGVSAKILGYIPTGWYPGAIVLDPGGKTLYVANVKGIGYRSQALDRPRGPHSHDSEGTVSIIASPKAAELEGLTKTVHENNSYFRMLQRLHPVAESKEKVPVPVLPSQTSFFRHVVYIIKENRTYDQVLGDMPQGNGDTSLVEFGREVTPNEHLLAGSFVLMDNYNCSGILSADGHQWTDEAYVTDYLEKSFGGFTRSYPFDGDDALAYAPGGFIWDDVLAHGLTFRDYGEFVKASIDPKKAGFMDIYNDFRSGGRKIRIGGKANVAQLAPYICPTFPGFGNRIPDVYRAGEFIRELKAFEQTGNFPNFIIMELPNDHTSGTSPGMPVPAAAAADNDLALGQIVDAISHSKFWKETCIFVTEDDPQAGVDHVDGHRTVGLVISPYTKRGQVVSTYYSQINMVRTIEDILGIPPMNQLDLSADPMLDCFTDHPDFTPYNTAKNRIPLDSLNLSLGRISGDRLYWARKSVEQNLNDADRIDEAVFNRIIWHAVKGYDRPYPLLPAGNTP